MTIFYDITQAVYNFMINAYQLFSWSYSINFGGTIGVVEISILGSLSVVFILAVIVAKLVALVIPN